MKRTTLGLLAGLTLWSVPALAQAPEPPSGADTESVQGEEHSLSGRVLRAGTGILYVESTEGPAVPLRITHATRVQGQRIPRAQGVETYLSDAFPPGTSVRVTFDVRTLEDGTPQNVVRTVEVVPRPAPGP
ncbi:hypothetical protein JY651_20625 [Pyxidicoccus parkwayensis]|uniref:DUF5666 domain-containing protein n=1 Tax=Pyxidicoccus parkwayensis TaxID=2813578 RepID=A0ABX7P9P8_9BACT|nr:hypothetical protein [Pyxidicoccus parkwaysis]QSQ27167.1 hypothetical protein JY651_20625 [Pyxidicoccus parkwaysis]